jgi:restriction system protein
LKKRDEWEAERLSKLKAFEEGRTGKIEALKAEHEKEKETLLLEVQKKNEEIDQLKSSYLNADPEAVVTYYSVVLDLSEYPDGFPQQFRIAYVPESKELAVEYELPSASVIPIVAEYKYTKSRDTIDEKPRRAQEIKDLYRDIVASLALRTLSEVLAADAADHLQVVVFNAFVHAIDPPTGKDIRPCLISVRTTKERFAEIDLKKVDKIACLRNLGAQVSPRPSELQAVKPIIEFDMVDKRFVQEGDIINGLDSRPNLMELNPFEFETLVCNLFGKMGLESKLTRSSRDGGVDAVAFDARPILGGKVVIQAKRYSNVVGVSAVRDLYGTMMNEGANKGILVTTSNYGPDAYNFSKDKPIELIDGGGLLYLLEQVGTKARIVFLNEGQ